MALETKTVRTTRPNVIRANPTQTTLLKNAFAISNVATPEQLKALSEATNLPEKWIHQWFGRQRGKDRKTKTKAASSSGDHLPDQNAELPSTSTSAAADLPASVSGFSESSSTMLITSTPDAALSPQEILQIKQEYHDPISASLLSGPLLPSSQAPTPIPYQADSMAGQSYASVNSISALSSGAVENTAPVSVSVSRPRRGGRVAKAAKQGQTGISNDIQKAPVAQKRSRRRGATQAARVKAEFAEPSLPNLAVSPVPNVALDLSADGQSMTSDHPDFAAGGTMIDAKPSAGTYTQFLPLIRPPRRSSISASRKLGPDPPVPQSAPPSHVMSTDGMRPQPLLLVQPDARGRLSGSRQRPANTSTVPAAFPLENSMQMTLLAKARQSDPPNQSYGSLLPLNQFHNQGPSNYSSKPPTLGPSQISGIAGEKPVTEMAAPAVVPSAPPLQYLYEWPSMNQIPRLEPAFYWSSDLPTEPQIPTSSAANDEFLYPDPTETQFGNREVDDHASQKVAEAPLTNDTGAESTSGSFLYPPLDLPSISSFLAGTVLDPLLAPLKHLIDILDNFKDAEGTYMPLMLEEYRPRLMNCLLDEGLAERSPFQAAMGLSLLSKLGVEWEV